MLLTFPGVARSCRRAWDIWSVSIEDRDIQVLERIGTAGAATEAIVEAIVRSWPCSAICIGGNRRIV
jgi:hypothetical protein